MTTNENGNRPIIAWVEDDSDFQEIVREWMLPQFDLLTYKDGSEFLDDMDDILPQAIMLDVQLPGPDGFKLCRKIREDKRLANTPILFLTSCTEDLDYIKHLDVGGTAYLSKPVDREELLSMLDQLVAESSAGMI